MPKRIRSSDPHRKQKIAVAENKEREAVARYNQAVITACVQRDLADSYHKLATEAVDLMRLVLTASEARPEPGVYFLLNARFELLYVGKSDNVLARMAGHRDKGYSHARMLHIGTEKERSRLEARFIHVLTPPLNIQLQADNATKQMLDTGPRLWAVR